MIMMEKRDFADMIIYFCQKVSEMNISRKYKMELLGMITAIEIKHDELMRSGDEGMNVRYMGVYWTPSTEKLPEDGALCVYHVKGNRADRIRYGGYSEKLKQFYDGDKGKWYHKNFVDFWMPIPILPTEEEVKK